MKSKAAGSAPTRPRTPPIMRGMQEQVKKGKREREWRTPNPFAVISSRIAGANLVKTGLPEKDKVKFVFVSLEPFPKSQQHITERVKPDKWVDADANQRQLLNLPRIDEEKLREEYFSLARQCLADLDADVLCFHELAFPTWGNRPLGQAAKVAGELAEEHKAVIVGGTQHDLLTFNNTGFLFYPNAEKPRTHFHKQVSASSASVGERISISPQRSTLVFEAFGLKIAILVCLDIADFSAAAAVVKYAERIDVLLVPCYTEEFGPLEKIARAVSEAMPGIVALVNHQRSPGRANCVVYSFGRETTPASTKLGTAMVSVLTLSPEGVRAKRSDSDRKPNRDLRWLFGLKDLVPRS